MINNWINKKIISIDFIFISIAAFLFSIMAANSFFGYSRDYFDYFNYFNAAKEGENLALYRFEVGFRLLTSILVNFIENFLFFYFFLVLISLLTKLYLIAKSHKNFLLWFLAYFFIIFPLHESTQIRVAIALSFFYLSIFLIRSPYILLSFFFLILSLTFHLSIIFFIPVYILLMRNNIKLILISLVSLFLLSFSIKDIIDFTQFYIDLYFNNSNLNSNIFSIRSLSLAAITFFGLVNISKIDSKAIPWLLLSLFGVLYFYLFSDYQILSYRLFEISLLSTILLVGFLPKKEKFFSVLIILFNTILAFYNFFFLDFFSSS